MELLGILIGYPTGFAIMWWFLSRIEERWRQKEIDRFVNAPRLPFYRFGREGEPFIVEDSPAGKEK